MKLKWNTIGEKRGSEFCELFIRNVKEILIMLLIKLIKLFYSFNHSGF